MEKVLYDYSTMYDEGYLNTLRSKAQNSWLKDINVDDWLRKIRGHDVECSLMKMIHQVSAHRTE